ncbi:MAG: hypothetical protein V4613_14820 [Bacteroidota bacterium]
MRKYLILLLLLVNKANSGYAQYSKYLDSSDAIMVSRVTPINGEFCIVQKNKKYHFKNADLGQFIVLNNRYIYAYNSNKHTNCIYYFDGRLENYQVFNRDSFVTNQSQRLNVNIEKMSCSFIPGNDTVCLFYCYSRISEFTKRHFIYLYDFRLGKITKLIYSIDALGVELGNDPISADFKLGIILNESHDNRDTLILIDILTSKVESMFTDVACFAFAKASNSLIISRGSSILVLDMTTDKMLFFIIKEGYWIKEINWIQGSIVYLQIQRNRRWGERYKFRTMRLNTNLQSLQKISMKVNGIYDL